MSTIPQQKLSKRNRFQNEKGVALIVYLFVLAAMSALAVAALQMTNLGFQMSESYKRGKKAFYSAEVGLDLAVNAIIKEFEDLIPYTESADYPGADGAGFIEPLFGESLAGKRLKIGCHLGSEGFVHIDEVDVAELHAGALQCHR
mgnify:CR=1 FL=1